VFRDNYLSLRCMADGANIAMNMTKVLIKFLQGSAVTQNAQGGLIIHSLVANFLRHISDEKS